MGKINYWEKLYPNHCYHIYNHAVGTEDLFKRSENYDYFLQKWDKYISPYFANYAYCLMPNHFHFLSKARPLTKEIEQLISQNDTKRAQAYLAGEVPINVFYESQFASLFKSYSQAINKQESNRYGSLFKAKFKRTLITERENFMYYLCYIHHNPIHHGITQDYQGWKRTSFHNYLCEHPSNTLKESDIYTPKLSIFSTLKIFQLAKDELGLNGFKREHQRFKKDFSKNKRR